VEVVLIGIAIPKKNLDQDIIDVEARVYGYKNEEEKENQANVIQINIIYVLFEDHIKIFVFVWPFFIKK
jgi:hypothetical protein